MRFPHRRRDGPPSQAAIDPTRYTVEILQQVDKSIPSSDLHVTIFHQKPNEFTVEGEATTAIMAIQFLDALKANPDLKAFQFSAVPPKISDNGHAEFQIYGKL